MALSRREFLAIGGSAALGTLLLSGSESGNKLKRLYATLTPEDEVRLGLEAWYATTCAECTAGCGLVVRILEGRAKKIEGNPFHPLNRGNTCARGQAALQGLYDSNRYKGPLRRIGPRGSSSFEQVSWSEAVEAIFPQFNKKTLFLAAPQTAHMHWLVSSFMQQIGSEQLYYLEPFGRRRLRWINKLVFDYDVLPYYDLSRADFILSFGAPFLEAWLSPVHYARAYGAFRQDDHESETGKVRRGRGTLIQIEPRLSLTAAAADRWIPCRPGTEGILALALANAISSPGEESSLFSQYKPTIVSERCGVSVEQIEHIAENLLAARSPLVLGGGITAGTTNGAFNLLAIHYLNRLLILQNKNVPCRPNLPSLLASLERFSNTGDGTTFRPADRTFQDLERLGHEILSGTAQPVQAVMIYGVDPISILPVSSYFYRALKRIPLIVSFSSRPDATTRFADWILPDHTPLESWGDNLPDPAPGQPVLGIRQPVVTPLFNTRATGNLLLEFIDQAGGNNPWKNFRELLHADLDELNRINPDRIEVTSVNKFKAELLSKGGWFEIRENSDGNNQDHITSVNLPPVAEKYFKEKEAVFEGDPEQFPFILLTYPALFGGQGGGTSRPWLQGTGDPMTTIAWETWVEVSPDVAAARQLVEGDLVEVESIHGKLTLPVYPYPGIRSEVVAIPFNPSLEAARGSTETDDRNPIKILSPRTDELTGDFAWIATRVRLRPIGKRRRIVKYEGSSRLRRHGNESRLFTNE